MDEPWRKAFKELDVEVLGAQTLARGAFWPTLAVAAALIDAGVISNERLLKIIDALHSIAALDAADRLGDVDDALLGLEEMRGVLEFLALQKGEAVEQLQLHETEASDAHSFRELLRRLRRE